MADNQFSLSYVHKSELWWKLDEEKQRAWHSLNSLESGESGPI